MSGSLSGEQVASFGEDGFLFPLRVASSEQTAAWCDEIESFERRWRDDPGLPRPFVDYTRANFHIVSVVAARLAHQNAILDAVESLIGPDILCWMAELIVKEPQTSKLLSVHQDLTYWGLNGADGLVTAWLALSDATVANGAMRFVRASHLRGQVVHRDTFDENNLLSRGQEIVVDFDPDDLVDVELQAGEMSLHHGLMFHGSGANGTDGRRIALVMRFVSPAVAQTVGARDFAMTVRGVNRSNHLLSTPVPFADFTPSALALHAEITAAQEAPLAANATDQLCYGR
ncbi:MAG: phytanoyl-CoA dioxygenase family protein [Ilumatobacteraceae bacterium]